MASEKGATVVTVVPSGPGIVADGEKARMLFHERLAFYEKLPTRAFMSLKELEREKYHDVHHDELTEAYEKLSAEGMSSFEILSEVHDVAPVAPPHDTSQPLMSLLRLSGTGLELALGRPDFWILMIFHTVLAVVYYSSGGQVVTNKAGDGKPTAPGWPPVSIGLLAFPGTLITFAIVFFLGQTYDRYLTQYHRITLTFGYLGELLAMLRVHMGDHASAKGRVVRHQLCKTIIALYLMVFANLPYNRACRVDHWAWWYCIRFNILTPTQVAELKPLQAMGNGNVLYNEIGTWFARGVWAQQSREVFNDDTAYLFMKQLWKVRVNLDALYTFPSGPVPFAYYQLLNFLTTIYLFLLSYTFVFAAPYWSIPVFFLILVGLVGIRELGNSMSNPLGSDKMDISVFNEVKRFIELSTFSINQENAYVDEAPELVPLEDPKVPRAGEEPDEHDEVRFIGDHDKYS
eukprot:TRINITY_DN6815_c0_g2_i1.p1 TRINITY_DN6815_c0_g2~~TRINITY_DN6815_c0_g2_i1.p1  ORF type:complete len:460 (+),score=89.09 TRINITY_DN6815_c0_g2_i1:130-1509(+)